MIDRDHALEHRTLGRAQAVASAPGFAAAVLARLDDVEESGGPDDPAQTLGQALAGAVEESEDLPAWAIVALTMLHADVEHGDVTAAVAFEVRLQVEEAIAFAARARHSLRAAQALLA